MDRFEPLRPLGRGGMGEVVLARDRLSGAEVALKRLPSEPGGAESALRFVREAEALARVAHPAVVRLVGWGQEGGRLWLAMEHLPGGTLEERVRRQGPLPEAEVAALGAALARGLSAAHAAGVIHRDVKPANVLLDAAGAPRLLDFGLTRSLARGGSLTATGVLLGTPAYVAPEQALGDPRAVGPAADVYGLGATLYFLLTGEPPHAAGTPLEILAGLLTRDPAPPSARRPGLDPGLERIVLRALARAPEARWPTAGALALALEGWVPRAPRPRVPRAAVVTGALLAAAAAGLGLGPLRAPAPPAAGLAAARPASASPPASAASGVAAALARAEAAQARGDADGLARAADELLALEPDNPAGLAWRAERRMLAGPQGPQAAVADVTRLLERHPGQASGWRLRAELDLLTDALESAVHHATRAIELEPGAAHPLVLRGTAHVWRGASELARRDAERAVGLELDVGVDPGRLAGRAKLSMACGLWDAAAADLERLAPLAEAVGPAAARQVERMREALATRRAGLPGPVHALLAEADAAWQREGPGAAERVLRRAVWSVDGHAWEARRALAELALARGDRAGAAGMLRAALAIHPDEPFLVKLLGQLHAELGQPPPELSGFARIALELAPSGERVPADDDLDAFVARNPDHAQGVLLHAFLRRSRTYPRADQSDPVELRETLDRVDRALARDPSQGSATVYAQRGELCLRLGDLPRALQDLELAVALDPAEPALRHKRGLVRARSGDAAGARQDLAWLEARAGRHPAVPDLEASLRRELRAR